MLAARACEVLTALATNPTTPSMLTKQSSRSAVLSLCKSLLFLRARLRLRPILTRLPFCMKGLLYRTAIRSRKEKRNHTHEPPPRDVPGPRHERLRLPEHRQQRPSPQLRSKGHEDSGRPLFGPRLPRRLRLLRQPGGDKLTCQGGRGPPRRC